MPKTVTLASWLINTYVAHTAAVDVHSESEPDFWNLDVFNHSPLLLLFFNPFPADPKLSRPKLFVPQTLAPS